jgi:hypothetical protein
VSSAGDVNGDGIDDILIGAFRASPNNTFAAGETYVVFGSDAGFASSLDLGALDGSNGFVINGIDTADVAGSSVSSAGDVNGDGIGDILIGASSADPNGQDRAGETYVVFGSDADFGASLDLSSLDGSNGFVINGIDPGDLSGYSVSGAGDINGDGFDDILIGADEADPNGNPYAGETYAVFGSDAGFGASLDLGSLDGSNGFVLNGIDTVDLSGRSVSSAGDINGDGIDDILIGAYQADPNGSVSGETYVVFGSDADFGASLDLSSLDGSNGFVINGIDPGDLSGYSVSGAGDINGDGFDDILIGAPMQTQMARCWGNLCGLWQRRGLWPQPESEGPRMAAMALFSTALIPLTSRVYSVSSAGDINGDGFDDILIGARGADPIWQLQCWGNLCGLWPRGSLPGQR